MTILNKLQLKSLLKSSGNVQKDLFAEALLVRQKYFGNNVYLRGIIEFSNICQKNCYYCGIRKNNKSVQRYRMEMSEIEACLDFIKQANYGSVVLQSGEMLDEISKEFLLKIVQLIHQKYPELGITLSCGEFDFDFLKKLKEAGAHRYLLRIEASQKLLYEQLHPSDHSFENRVEVLKNLKKLNYQVGTGNLIGTPYQTLDDLVEDLMFFQKMDFDMFGLGPYVPHENTPLFETDYVKHWGIKKEEILNTTLNFIALLRIMMPTCNIATATALDSLHSKGRILALQAGANVIMPSVTPQSRREDYFLYQNKSSVDAGADETLDLVLDKVLEAGFIPVFGERGNAVHFCNRM